ncbi:HEPN domain-containing protein [Candidatus Woesearchaeota archaeon]|nr:HEPN domain-containing protein [Candidatus Woesearchaeota archaeon]
MLAAAREQEEHEWIATTAYYARYFSAYAVLQRCGITSKIHDCTIAVISLMAAAGIVEERHHQELEEAKHARIDTQYYLPRPKDEERMVREATKAHAFVLDMEEAASKLREASIRRIRERAGLTEGKPASR